MGVKDSNTQAIIDAITNLVKETQQSNRIVEREIKNLSVNTKSYIEKAQSSANFEKVFESFSKEFSTNISESINETVKDANEKTFKQLKEGIQSKKQEIEKRKKDLKSSASLGPEFQKDLNKKIKQSEKELRELIENYDKTARTNNQNLIQQIRESQTKLTEELTGGLQEFGKSTFKNYVKETNNVDEALIKYKNALKEQYTSLEQNAETRKKLGLTDKKMEEIKEDLYDSYFKELEAQSNKADLDEKTRKVLTDKLKREQILAGRSTYEQTYGKTSSIGQLAGRLADFTTSRYKKQNQNTSALGKAFNAGLGALFKGKDAKEPFLEADKNDLSTKPSITQKDIEGGEGSTYINPYSESENKETVETAQADKVAAENANASVNPSAQVEALEAIQQSFEEAKENVPFKVVISDLDPKAQKGMTAAFNEAFKESLGPIVKDALALAIQGGQKGMVKALGKPEKKEKEGGSIIDVEDIIDLIPKGKKGFFKKTAQRGRIAAKKAARGIGKAARGLSRVATGGVGIGGLLGTNVGAIGSLGAGAVATSGLLAAGTVYGGYKAGEALEENFGLGTKAIEAVGVNKETNQLEKTQEDLNSKLQDVSKIKDPNERRIAYFEAQLDTLEKQKTIQSGDEKAQTEHMITVVKGKLEKLKTLPKVEPAPTAKPASTPEIGAAANVAPAIVAAVTAATPEIGAAANVAPAATASPIAGASMPTITANIPQPKDVSPELNTNNKLTEQTNQILGDLVKVMAGKDYNPTSITPIMVSQAAPSQLTGQTQSPAYQFRSQNRTE
jgi:hypothetical protein